jgi:hypothetical protein
METEQGVAQRPQRIGAVGWRLRIWTGRPPGRRMTGWKLLSGRSPRAAWARRPRVLDVRRSGRRRRPTGQSPPLPRGIQPTGVWWAAAAVVLVTLAKIATLPARRTRQHTRSGRRAPRRLCPLPAGARRRHLRWLLDQAQHAVTFRTRDDPREALRRHSGAGLTSTPQQPESGMAADRRRWSRQQGPAPGRPKTTCSACWPLSRSPTTNRLRCTTVRLPLTSSSSGSPTCHPAVPPRGLSPRQLGGCGPAPACRRHRRAHRSWCRPADLRGE